VSGVVVDSGKRYRSLLTPSDGAVGQREFTTERFRGLSLLHGEPVLLLDDTWTTGAHAHGAAAALKAAGAGAVGVVAIGRWYHPSEDANQRVEEQLRGRRWTWDECMLER
jgi:predicted phosphoribosyltransferase